MRPALLHYLTAVQRGDSSYDSHLTEEMESGEQSREVTHPCPRATKWLCLGGEAGFSDRLSLPHHLVSLTSGLLGHQLFQQVSSPLFEWVQSCLHLASTPPPNALYTWVLVWNSTCREEPSVWAARALLCLGACISGGILL